MDGSEFELAGAVAVVTGATSGIGAEVAKQMAAAGAQVVLVGRDRGRGQAVLEEIESAGGEAILAVADLATGRDASEGVVRSALEAFDSITCVVHSAGLFRPGDFEQVDDDDIEQQWVVNVRVPFELTQAALPHLREGSSVIFISSTAGHYGFSGTSYYAATKGAIEALARALQAELSPRGIRFNTISPGWIATAMNEELRAGDPGVADQAIAATLAGRLGSPADIAPAAVFLASEGARFVYGINVDVAGGHPSIDEIYRSG